MRDIYEWEDGNCDFYFFKICICKMCDGDEDFECECLFYKIKYFLFCEYYWFVYVRVRETGR